MEVLTIVFSIGAIVALYYLIREIIYPISLLLSAIWYSLPMIIGIAISVYLLYNDYDNLGILSIMAMVVAMTYWVSDENYKRPLLIKKCPQCKNWSGKVSSHLGNTHNYVTRSEVDFEHYDSDGNHTGTTKNTGLYTKQYGSTTTYKFSLTCNKCAREWEGKYLFDKLLRL